MFGGEKSAPVVDLFPVRYGDGKIRYVAWPEATAAAIAEALRRGAVSAANWLAAVKPKTLFLCAGGAFVLFVVFPSGRKRRR